MKDIQQVLESGEKIEWHDKQHLASTMLASLLGFFIVLGIGLIFYFVVGGGSGECIINDRPASPEECAHMSQLFSYLLFVVAILIVISGYIHYKVTTYTITNKRLLLKSGWIGADIRSIYFDQIKTAFVDVGIVGKIFGTGIIKIDTGRTTSTDKGGTRTEYDKFKYVAKPYDVFKLVQAKLSDRKESLYSGRADRENNPEAYKK